MFLLKVRFKGKKTLSIDLKVVNFIFVKCEVYILENTGGNKYGLRGKKYHKNNARADKKGEKERKDKGKEKKSDKMTEQEQCFIKVWKTWKKCRQ